MWKSVNHVWIRAKKIEKPQFRDANKKTTMTRDAKIVDI